MGKTNLNKNFFLSKSFIIPTSLYLVLILIFVYFKTSQEPFVELEKLLPFHEEYFEPISIGIQILIGIVVIMTGFYLGKIHDYKRDFIKQNANFYEIYLRTKSAIDSIPDLQLEENSKKEFEEAFDIKIDDMDSAKKVILEILDPVAEAINSIEKDLLKMPRNILLISIPTIFLFLMILFSSIIIKENPSIDGFFTVTFGLLIALVGFGLAWYLYEQMIHILDKGLKTLMFGTSKLKLSYEKLLKVIQKIDLK